MTVTYLTPQQRPSPDWMVSARGLRGKPIGPGREVRAEPKFELPKLRGGLPSAECCRLTCAGLLYILFCKITINLVRISDDCSSS